MNDYAIFSRRALLRSARAERFSNLLISVAAGVVFGCLMALFV